MEAKERYDYLIKARNFHYENYNKWMTFFYVIIGALFIGLYTILGKTTEDIGFEKNILVFIVTIIGYVFSILWYWSNKGYYFWNINFITLVNNHEKKIMKLKAEERVYAVFANKNTQNNYNEIVSGANFSTSKISILITYFIAYIWGTAMYYLICILVLDLFNYLEYSVSWGKGCFILQFVIFFIISSIFSFCTIKKLPNKYVQEKLGSKIDHFPDLNIQQNNEQEERESS